MDGTRSAQLNTSSTTKIATLFDTLPTDALTIIVKEIGDLPFTRVSDELTPDIPAMCRRARFLAMLFAENSPFRAAAATLVSTIEVQWTIVQLYVRYGQSTLHMGPEMFEGEAKEMELGRIVFSACGPFVRKIIVKNIPAGKRNAKAFVEKATSHVFQYCRNVEQVSLAGYRAPLTKWGTASLFFREYAASLRMIDLDGEEDETGFPDLRQCTNLRRSKSRKLNSATLISLLEASGRTLEELDISITPAGDSVEIMDAIRNHCKNLKVIHIENAEDVINMIGQVSYSFLIRGYGSQLKKTTMNGLDSEHLVEVVNTCTNLELTVGWSSNESVDWRRLHDLGLRVVNLRLPAGFWYGDEYPEAFERCSSLRELTIAGILDGQRSEIADKMIETVFSPSRFPKLEFLCVEEFIMNERNMCLIASCAKNLKFAGFERFEADSPVSAFELIANSYRHLKEVTIGPYVPRPADESAEAALESLSELVKMFRKCPTLWLEIPCANGQEVKEEDVNRILKVLPCRDVDVHVSIGEVHYGYRK